MFTSYSSNSRRYLRLAAATTLVCGGFLGLLWLVAGPPDLERAKRQARDLECVVHVDTRFVEAHVEPSTNGSLMVFAPQSLPSGAKADLERLVAEHGPRHTTVSYLAPVSAAP